MPAGSGSSSRGRGGKFKKYTRGGEFPTAEMTKIAVTNARIQGGHHFSRNLQPIDSEGNPVSMWSNNKRSNGRDEDEDESSEEESEEEEDSDEDEDSDEAGKKATTADASREDRKALKKARKDAAIARAKGKNVEVGDMPSSDDDEDDDEDDMPANPNHSKSARKQAAKPTPKTADTAGVKEITEGVKKMTNAPMSRREREAAEAAAARERYMKLHLSGKTDEAKADLARLKIIREQRAADAARKQVSYYQVHLFKTKLRISSETNYGIIANNNIWGTRLRKMRGTHRRRNAKRRLRREKPRGVRRQLVPRRRRRRNRTLVVVQKSLQYHLRKPRKSLSPPPQNDLDL